MPPPLDLPAILSAIRETPDDGSAWLAVASGLWDNGRDDVAVAVRVFWPALRDNVTVLGVSLHATLRQMGHHAAKLGRRAREIEARDGHAA